MRRSSNAVIEGWALLLWAPILIPLMVFELVRQTIFPSSRFTDRTPAEVIGFIEDFIDGTGGEWDWDEFESVPISDPVLDAYRERACRRGPPGADLKGLRQIVNELRERFPEVR